jgi:hypothetical protein
MAVLNFSACPKEGGLLGSQAVAKSYEANGVNVIAMSQVSMACRFIHVLILGL